MVRFFISQKSEPLWLTSALVNSCRFFASIMKEILPYLGIYPDGEIDYHVDLNMIADIENENYDPFEDEKNPFVLPEGLDASDE